MRVLITCSEKNNYVYRKKSDPCVMSSVQMATCDNNVGFFFFFLVFFPYFSIGMLSYYIDIGMIITWLPLSLNVINAANKIPTGRR
jgi:hypothetical protein